MEPDHMVKEIPHRRFHENSHPGHKQDCDMCMNPIDSESGKHRVQMEIKEDQIKEYEVCDSCVECLQRIIL